MDALEVCRAQLAEAEEMTAHYLGLLDKAGVPVTHELPAPLRYPQDGDRSGLRPRFSALARIAVLEDQLAAAERREDTLRAENKVLKDPPIGDLHPGCREDFYAWLLAQAKALREGRFGDVDRKYLPDFLEGRAESLLYRLADDAMLYFAALNNWFFGGGKSDDPEKVEDARWGVRKGWRSMKSDYLDASPSIKALLPGMMQEIYDSARPLTLPRLEAEQCPYGPEVFEDDFEVVADKWFIK